MQGLYQMVFPPFSESNLFDALADVLDRMKDAKGKKSVLVLASGIDTFSKMNLDQVMKRIRETDATIFTVGVGEQFFIRADAGGGMGSGAQLTYLQAQNQLKNFRGDDGRTLVAPALRWRDSQHHAGRWPQVAQPVQHGLLPFQFDARWQVPQDQG